MTITYSDDNGQTVTVTNEGVDTWMDAIEIFFGVLRAAGYRLDFDTDEAVSVLEDMNHEAR